MFESFVLFWKSCKNFFIIVIGFWILWVIEVVNWLIVFIFFVCCNFFCIFVFFIIIFNLLIVLVILFFEWLKFVFMFSCFFVVDICWKSCWSCLVILLNFVCIFFNLELFLYVSFILNFFWFIVWIFFINFFRGDINCFSF